MAAGIMNKANEINPMLRLVEDQFSVEFSRQMKTAIAMTDALFPVAKVRKPKMEDKVDEVIALSRKIATLCRELKYTIPSEFDSALEESKLDAEGILTNFAAIRMHLSKPYVPCDCGGVCDSCVAGRSDKHYDRQRDGQLCDEA